MKDEQAKPWLLAALRTGPKWYREYRGWRAHWFPSDAELVGHALESLTSLFSNAADYPHTFATRYSAESFRFPFIFSERIREFDPHKRPLPLAEFNGEYIAPPFRNFGFEFATAEWQCAAIFTEDEKSGALLITPFSRPLEPKVYPSVLVHRPAWLFVGEDHQLYFCSAEYEDAPELNITLGLFILREAVETLKILSCTNVTQEPKQPHDPYRGARAVNEPSGMLTYHVLTVKHGCRPHAAGKRTGKMRLHRCRGHFAKYGPQFGKRLLFGQIAGQVFIPPHIRGDGRNGTVITDYRV
jgi:hypothetical protein